MKKLFYTIYAVIFRICRLFPVKRGRVALVSPHNADFNDSLGAVKAELERRGSYDIKLITRRVIKELEGCDPDRATLEEYADPDSEKYRKMVEKIGEKLHFTSLHYHRLDDMMESVGIDADCLCTYCWNGKE